jgi:Tol biopolymer transport system component
MTVVAVTAVAMAGATIAVNLTSRAPAAPAPGATATAVPHLAFFSEFHPVLMQEGADGPSTLFNAYTEQPAGRGTALAFIGHQPVRGDTEHDGEVYYQAKPGDTPRALTDDDAVQAHPAISPNGAQVAFASKRSGNWDIWVVGTDGTGLRQLTDSPADDTWPTWSPDGGRIAFSSTRDDPAGDIYVMPARGGAATRITTDPAADIEPAWAPGGSQIAFTTTRARAAGDIALVGDNGGAVTLVTQATMSGTQAAWHPDGKQLAFVSRDADPAGDIYAIDVTVAPVVPRPVAVTPGVPEHTPTWRDATGVRVTYTAGVDGTRFEGHTAADIWSAGLDGSAQADLTNRPNLIEQAPAYSPDGRRLAYREQRATGQPGITVADADGRNPKVLTTSTAAAGDDHPSWSPDGNLIAFDRSVGALSDRRAEIVIVRAADGVQVATVPCVVPGADTCEDAEPAWSPDGRQLAFTRYSFTRPVVIGAPRLGQPGNGQPAPGQPRTDGAGSGFAGVSLRTGPVPAVAPPPAAARPAALPAGPVAAPTGPDGREQFRHVWTVAVQRPTATTLTFGAQADISGRAACGPCTAAFSDQGPDYRPDGRQLVFARDGAALLTVNPDGTAGRVLYPSNPADGTNLQGLADPAYAPDGATIAFAGSVPGAGFIPSGTWSGSDLYALPAAGGAPRLIVGRPGEDSQPVFRPEADLSVDLDPVPAAIPQGATTDVTVTVTDKGPSPATGVRSKLAVPAGLTAVSITTANGTCTLATLTCDLGTVASAAQARYTVRLRGTAFGTHPVTATVSGARPDLDPSNDSRTKAIVVGTSPDVAVTLSVAPQPGYVGGAPVVATYTVVNEGDFAATGVKLTAGLPAQLPVRAVDSPVPCTTTPVVQCSFGTLNPGQPPVTVRVTLGPDVALNTLATGTVSADSDADPADNTATAPLQVRAPALVVNPPIGKPGFVPQAVGRDFPPGATIRLTWEPGITRQPDTVVVDAGGAFAVPVLVFHKDQLGRRVLRATPVAGPAFGPVTAPFLVSMGAAQPGDFVYRR